MGQSEKMTDVEPSPTYTSSSNSSTLLKKYNIPIQHFDFDYVEKCTDGKELERILHVLKSGEEGYYPHLLAKTEERLSKIKPNSRHVRSLTRVLSRNELDERSSEEVTEDLKGWLSDIGRKNKELSRMKNAKKADIPQVRKNREEEETKKKIPPQRIKSTDYAAWDKYDVDTELLKMDLEEEKIKKDAKRKSTVKFGLSTDAEAAFEAERENVIAKEYFKAKEYDSALEHYNNSIVCHPNGAAYANRGATHLCMKKYEEAIEDYIKALKYDPGKSEYVLKLGKSYSLLNKWSEALNCAEIVIRTDPHNKIAQKLAEKARRAGGKVDGNKVRLSITDVTSSKAKKSILKREERPEIIPIPGSSKACGPYYKAVYSKDPDIINKEKDTINNCPKRIFMANIEIESDDEDFEFVELPASNYFFKKCDDINASRNKSKKGSEKSDKISTSSGNDAKTHERVTMCKNIQKSEESRTSIRLKTPIATNQQGTSTGFTDIKAGGEPFLEENRPRIDTNNVNTPFSFLQAWQSTRRDSTYAGFASILRNLDLDRITEVMGNKIDSIILSDVLNCLYRHFMVADEMNRVYDILLNMCRLERFGIVVMFLSTEERRLVRSLLDFLKQHGRDLPQVVKDQYL